MYVIFYIIYMIMSCHCQCQIAIDLRISSLSFSSDEPWVWLEHPVSAPEHLIDWGVPGKGWGSRQSLCCCKWAELGRCWRRSQTRPRVWSSPGLQCTLPSERGRSSWWWLCSALCTPGEESNQVSKLHTVPTTRPSVEHITKTRLYISSYTYLME